MPKSVVIASIPLNRRECARVALKALKRRRLVDVRTMLNLPDLGDEPFSTAKGVSVDVVLLPELIRALEEAETRARQLGWL